MPAPKNKSYTFSVYFDIEEVGGDGEGVPEWALEEALEEAMDEIWEKYKKRKAEFSLSSEIEITDDSFEGDIE